MEKICDALPDFHYCYSCCYWLVFSYGKLGSDGNSPKALICIDSSVYFIKSTEKGIYLFHFSLIHSLTFGFFLFSSFLAYGKCIHINFVCVYFLSFPSSFWRNEWELPLWFEYRFLCSLYCCCTQTLLNVMIKKGKKNKNRKKVKQIFYFSEFSRKIIPQLNTLLLSITIFYFSGKIKRFTSK
jgi:hypothetical protein